MTNHPMINELAALAARTDADDLVGLTALHDGLLDSTFETFDDRGDEAASVASRAAGMLQQIILRETEDVERAFGRVYEALDYLLALADATAQGAPTDHVRDPFAADGDGASTDDAPGTTAASSPADATGAGATSDRVAPEGGSDGAGVSTGGGSAAGSSSVPDADIPVDLSVEDEETLAEFLTEAREHLEGAEEAVLEIEQGSKDPELINRVFRAFHTIKGIAGFMNLGPVASVAHSAEFLLDSARSGDLELAGSALELILESSDMLGLMVTAIQGEADAPTAGAVGRLIERLDLVRAGEPDPGPAPSDASTERPDATEPSGREAATGGTGTRASSRVDQTIKVNTGRLDSLVDMVGELVIAQQMVVQDPGVQSLNKQQTQRNLTQVGKIIRDLQEVAMSLRMVTVRSTFQRMSRLVRDVSQKAGKTIEFRMEGEETELDRNVVDEIGDPLVHMVRNACDHGIETAEERRAAGKPSVGSLTLRAFHKGGSIVIEIQDDGRGLNREKILAKAIERGVLPPDRDPAELRDEEVFNLIFMPGFSTAEKVTDISGRGVGMDVVRRNIEALRGKVEIRSTEGEGSTFIMRLPLTMAIIDGMVVRVGTQRYVIPTLAIEQSFRPSPDILTTVVGRGETALVRGSLLPVYRLNRVLHLREGMETFDDTLLVVLESNNSRFCLMVDEILGQQQVVIKSLGYGVGQLRGVSGGAILGDGRVALILDVSGLLSAATDSSAGPRAQTNDRLPDEGVPALEVAA